MAEYIHQKPGTEIQCIGGHYTITEEGLLTYRERTLLYVVGIAIVGSACCGTGGCRFINIPGYITSRQFKIRPDGLRVSEVELVTLEKDRKDIKKLLAAQFPHSHCLHGLEIRR